ncbi:hypothetical protein CK203_102817 [Vitis vinifera]|uniref:DUF506 domain-containing protein n=1 Tax=Vitis vinifera TaxID=29760 RepID=A0A438F6E6_VITVI|nr:hypothetical protein CK203_102817 [Vitis vinifera]
MGRVLQDDKASTGEDRRIIQTLIWTGEKPHCCTSSKLPIRHDHEAVSITPRLLPMVPQSGRALRYFSRVTQILCGTRVRVQLPPQNQHRATSAPLANCNFRIIHAIVSKLFDPSSANSPVSKNPRLSSENGAELTSAVVSIVWGTENVKQGLEQREPVIISVFIFIAMPFPMKIQPIDIDSHTPRETIRADSGKPVLKSRLKRLFDRQFHGVLKNSSTEKPESQYSKDGGVEFEPSSVCLAKMVQNFIEESNEKQTTVKCGRNRCNCFNGNGNDSSDDEFDGYGGFGEPIVTASSGDASDLLKGLIPCASVAERNLLADTAKIVEKNKIKPKDDLTTIVMDGLSALGYDASICKSRWEKSPSYPAGEYEFIDVIVDGERLLIDIDFRSEFEIARSTGVYKAILQSLPYIFVGKPDRLQQIVSIVSEAAKQSLKKKGMHFPPWRKSEYMRAKWLSPYTRTTPNGILKESENKNEQDSATTESECGEFELIFGEESTPPERDHECTASSPAKFSGEGEKIILVVSPWQPPAIKPKSCERGAKVVTGLASLLKEKP